MGAVLAAALLVIASPAGAQERPEPRPGAAEAPAAPDRFEAARLVWSTLIAVDQANRTGNYTVLRDLGAPSFREANDPSRLADIFQALRQEDLGLGRTVLLTPSYEEPPSVDETGHLRLRGIFATRPVGIRFDLMFESHGGAWLLFNIGIASYQPDEQPAGSGGDGG